MNTQFTFILLLLFAVGTHLSGQSNDTLLRVGVTNSPPYCIKGAEGNWRGMSVELWRHLAEASKTRYELVELEESTSRPQALTDNRIDIALTTDLAYRKTDSMAFLQHHHLTTLGVALPKRTGIWSIVKGVLTLQFLYIVLGLSALLLIIGTVIYFLERKDNDEQFGGDRSLAEGIGSGFWWAGVTMTTIGYGDKAPATLGGRIVAMLWMLVAMAVSASLTASVIAATDNRQTISFPDDLSEMKVAVMEASPAAEYLENNGYQFQTYPTVLASLRALDDREVEAVVADATALNYELNKNKNVAANVTTTNEGPVAYSLMVKENDGLADRLDAHLVEFLLSPAWRTIVKEYGGEKLDK